MPVITTYASMSSRGFSSKNTQTLSSTYARYLPITNNVNTQIRLQARIISGSGNNSYFDYSTDGSLYVISFIRGGTNNEPLIVSKYLNNNYFSDGKTILLSEQIWSAAVFCNGSFVYVVTTSASGTLSFIKLDSNLNIIWSVVYSEVGLSYQDTISITIDSTSTYIYISTGSYSTSGRRFYIFQNDGTLINAYNANAWFDDPNVITFDTFTGTKIMAGDGRTFFTLSSLTNISSVTCRKLSPTSKQYTQPVCYYINGGTRNAYTGFYYNNTGVWYSGIAKRDFNGNNVGTFRYVFSGITYPQFLGLTVTDTNIYAYVTDFYYPYNLYIMKFDTSLNYINGYTLTNPGATGTPLNTYVPTYTPKYFNDSITSTSLTSFWRLPADLSLLANGTYVVDGVTWTKSTYSGTVTRFTYTLSVVLTTPAVTTVTPTLVSFTPTVTATTDSFTYVGL